MPSQVFEKAVEWGKFEGIYAFLNRFKIKKGKKPGALSPEQVQAIINEVDHPVKRDMIQFAYYQGWRISEIRKLKWNDIDLESGLAWIVDPKNGESVLIPLGDEALEIISRQSRQGEYVFCHLNGQQYKTNLQDVFRNAAQRAGVSLPARKQWHIVPWQVSSWQLEAL